MVKSAAAFANSRLHAVKAEALILIRFFNLVLLNKVVNARKSTCFFACGLIFISHVAYIEIHHILHFYFELNWRSFEW